MRARATTVGVALLVVLSMVAAVPGIATAQQSGQVVGSPDLSFGSSIEGLSPGQTTELSIGVTNRGSIRNAGPERHENRVTTARGMTFEVDDSDVPIDVETGQVTVGNLPTGSIDVGPFPVSVSADAEPGTYEVPIEYEFQYTRIARYDGTNVEYQDNTRTETGTLEIEVSDRPNFQLVSKNSSAQVGDSGEVSVTLENTGSQVAGDASVTVSDDSGSLTFDAGSQSATAAVGQWAPGETRTVNYSVSVAAGASARTYTTDLTVSYTDVGGVDRTSPVLDLAIPVSGEQTFTLTDVTSELYVGEDGEISGTVTNTGPQVARSVVVQYADEASNVVPIEQSVAVGTLEPGASSSFSLPIEVVSEARAGAKSLSIAVQYRNQDGDRQRYEKLDVLADVASEREQFSVALQNRTIEAGGARTITVEVTNNMEQTASDVEARLFADDPLDPGDTDEGYVESIDPGETVTVTFGLSAGSSAAADKTYPISFDFRYDDERGNSHLTNTIRVPVDVTAGGGGSPLSTIVLVGLALVGVGAFVWYRRN